VTAKEALTETRYSNKELQYEPLSELFIPRNRVLKMRLNVSEMEYLSEADKSIERRYQKLIASPIAKLRLKGESWICHKDVLKLKSTATRFMYTKYLLFFLEWLDYDTEQLFNEYLKLTRDKDPRKVKIMRRKLNSFQDDYTEKRGITDVSSETIYCAVKSFFKANELPFAYYARNKHKRKQMTNISKEQLRKILGVTGSPKVKSYITFAKDSGLRISDLVALPIRKIRAVLDDPFMEYHTFEWKTIKTGEMANPVIGPETIKSLREWMRYRGDILDISANDGDPVFPAERNARAFIDKNGKEVRAVTKGSILDAGCLSANFSALRKKAGLKHFPGESRLPSIHSCRKFHQTALESMHVPTNWINKMTGRKGEGTSGVYSKPPENELIEQYRYAYPALSLTEIVQDDENKNLKLRLAETEQKLVQLTEIPGYAEVMARMNDLQHQIDNLSRG